MMGCVADDVPQRMRMDVVEMIEKLASFEKVANRSEAYGFAIFFSDFSEDLANDLLFFDFKGVSLDGLLVVRKLDLLLEHLIVVVDHILCLREERLLTSFELPLPIMRLH